MVVETNNYNSSAPIYSIIALSGKSSPCAALPPATASTVSLQSVQLKQLLYKWVAWSLLLKADWQKIRTLSPINQLLPLLALDIKLQAVFQMNIVAIIVKGLLLSLLGCCFMRIMAEVTVQVWLKSLPYNIVSQYMEMLRQSLKQSKDRHLIRKALDSLHPQKNHFVSLKGVFRQPNINSNDAHQPKRSFQYGFPLQKQQSSFKAIKYTQQKVAIKHEINRSNDHQARHQQLSLMSISKSNIDNERSHDKKKNVVYLRKCSDKSKPLNLNPMKTQQIGKKDQQSRKKVFYLSINRSPLQKYDSRSQNLYHLPDFHDRNGQTPTSNNKSSCTMRYLDECLSKSTNKPLKISRIRSIINTSLQKSIDEKSAQKRALVSAFPQPAPIKYKPKKLDKDGNTVFNSIHDYVMTKKMRYELQKSFKVQSKRQEIYKNNSQRYKVENIKPKYVDKSPLERKVHSQQKQKKEKEKRQSNYRFVLKKELVPSPKRRTSEIQNKSFNDFVNHKQNISIYEQKMMSYRELLFLLNIAHRVFDPLVLIDHLQPQKSEKATISKYHYYIGPGNNSKLIRALMKRRPWWSECQDCNQADFAWTQLKVRSVYAKQIQRSEALHKTIHQNLESIDEAKLKHSTDLSMGQNIKQYIFKPPFAFCGAQKVLLSQDAKIYSEFIKSASFQQFDQFSQRIKYFPESFFTTERCPSIMHNHLQFNHWLGNKKALFYHLRLYYRLMGRSVSSVIPLTYHVKSLEKDANYQEFIAQFTKLSKNKAIKNIWIVKPGENSNRGAGIDVFNDVRRLKFLIKDQKYKNGQSKTYIIQKYIQRPLLYQGRKFDIRHYMIITTLYGHMRAYWYGEGYIRTSSYQFSLAQLEDPTIHLTNDAIQKQSKDYGSHEEGNKISYMQLQRYFDKYYPFRRLDFKSIYVRMRQIGKEVLCSTYLSLSQSKKVHNFEIFGLDFMVDDHMKVNLIQINTNPCLQISSGLLGRVIPLMVQQTLRVSVDVIFPPKIHYNNNLKSFAPDCSLQKLQMELIFDEAQQKHNLEQLYAGHKDQWRQMIANLTGNQDDDETFDNEGDDVEIDRLIT